MRRNAKTRHGGLLIELILLITFVCAIMASAVQLIHRSFHLTSKFQGYQRVQESFQRLAHIFRSDAHLSGEAKMDADNTLELDRVDGHRVRYLVKDGYLMRVESGPEHGEYHERYPLPQDAIVEWKIVDLATNPSAVELNVKRPRVSGEEEMRYELHLIARLDPWRAKLPTQAKERP